MTLLFHDVHLTIEPAVLLSILTLLGGIVGALGRRRMTRGRASGGRVHGVRPIK